VNTIDIIEGRAKWALQQGEALAFLRDLPTGCADAIVTDPPYSSGGAMRGDRLNSTTIKYVQTGTLVERPDFAGDTRDGHGFRYWEALWMAEALRVAKPGAPMCVFTDWRQLAATTDAIQAGGWVFRGIVPWDKTESARPTVGRFSSQCEYVVWGSAGPMPETRQIGGGKRTLFGLVRCRVDRAEKRHLTGKPIAVMRHINAICEPGGLIVDPFAGSGSTGLAALRDGYRFLGCEKVEAYATTATDWLAAEERAQCAPSPSP
jgi:site-specific DNA-methyltransferase (adenine-specific)